MAEAWERAVAAALKGQTEPPRSLTLDGAVKSPDGRLPSGPLFRGKLASLSHLSIANVRLSSLDGFPRLSALRRLVLSDNRIAGGLQVLVEAGLDELRDLDLSNNRIASIEDLAPLAKLRLESLDLYECPVTKIEGYRSKVFGLISSLKYLDKVDAHGNERPETDDEEEEEEEEEEEDVEEEEDDGQGDDVGEEMNNEEEENEEDEGEEEEDDEDEEDEGDAHGVEEEDDEEDLLDEMKNEEAELVDEEEDDDDEEDGDEDDEEEGDKLEGDEQNGIIKQANGTSHAANPVSTIKNESGASKDGDNHCNGASQHQSSTSKRKREGDDP